MNHRKLRRPKPIIPEDLDYLEDDEGFVVSMPHSRKFRFLKWMLGKLIVLLILPVLKFALVSILIGGIAYWKYGPGWLGAWPIPNDLNNIKITEWFERAENWSQNMMNRSKENLANLPTEKPSHQIPENTTPTQSIPTILLSPEPKQ